MGVRITLLLTVAVDAGCVRKQLQDPPPYTITIPDDVPKHLVLTDKDGVKHASNGRELYADGHKAGWRLCWEEHSQGRVAANDEDAWERYIPQDYGVAVRGFEAGFKQCQASLPR